MAGWGSETADAVNTRSGWQTKSGTARSGSEGSDVTLRELAGSFLPVLLSSGDLFHRRIGVL